MNSARPVVAVGLSLIAIVLVIAAAQGGTTRSLVLDDPIGDLSDWQSETTDGPGHMDVTKLTVSVEGQGLVVRFDVAGPLPEDLSGTEATARFNVAFKSRTDGSGGSTLSIGPETGYASREPAMWRARLFDTDSSLITPLNNVIVADRSLTVTVPLSALGSPQRLRFRGDMFGIGDMVIGDREAHIDTGEPRIWTDNVPDDGSWTVVPRSALSVGSADSEVPLAVNGPIEDLQSRDISTLFTREPPEGDITVIRMEFLDYVASRPSTADLLSMALELTDEVFGFCEEELAAGTDAFDDPVDPANIALSATPCGSAFAALYMAYAQTGDELLYGLLDRFIGATGPRHSEEASQNYARALASIPEQMQRLHPQLFGASDI